jgi:flagellar biosynthesis protein FliR
VNLQTLIAALAEQAFSYLWPALRIGAFLMVMPLVGSAFVPTAARALLAFSLTIVIVPVLPDYTAPAVLSPSGVILIFQELVIGVAMGFAVKLIFDAVTLGGQVIAMSMGLGFAVFLDQARGINIPVLGQLFLMLAVLTFVSLNGHLALIRMLADSFTLLPIGGGGLGRASFWELVQWSNQLFVVAMSIALPAIIALIVVNLSFGVMSRAAPTLNLFAVGFPVSMLLGFVIVFLNMGGVQENVARALSDSIAILPSLLNP